MESGYICKDRLQLIAVNSVDFLDQLVIELVDTPEPHRVEIVFGQDDLDVVYFFGCRNVEHQRIAAVH